MGALTYLLCQQWSCLAAYAGNVSLMTPCREREAARQAAETRYAEPGTWHLEQAAHVTLLEHYTCARYMKHDTCVRHVEHDTCARHVEHHTLCLCGAISVLPKAVAVHTTWIDE